MIKVSEAVDHNRSRVCMPSSLISTVTRHQGHMPGDLADDAERLITLAEEVNLTSAITLTQQMLPLLREGARDAGGAGSRVIALSSITGAYAEAGLAAYGASKAALMSFMALSRRREEVAPGGAGAARLYEPQSGSAAARSRTVRDRWCSASRLLYAP
ncbi:SDR family NAD(P)-dependent oxidoreductase [Streptomyces sp. NBC_01589]|uniref:SDR family NAD(P)-dependent oxidoreductase n=1 Tax=unclassified Streptomyces TaxID=2593676 RepID=UPI003862EAC6